MATVSAKSGAGSLLTALTETTERAGGGREAAGSAAGGRSASGLAALLAGLAGLLLGNGGGGHKGAETGVSGEIGRVWKGESLPRGESKDSVLGEHLDFSKDCVFGFWEDVEWY